MCLRNNILKNLTLKVQVFNNPTQNPIASLIFSQNDKDDIKSLSGKYKRTPKF